MKSMNKTFIAIFVMGVVLAGTMSQAEAANTVWDDRQITNIVNDHQDQITQNNADSINRDIATDNRLTQVNDDLQSTKPGVLVVDKMANDAHQKALLVDTASLKSETALQGVATNGKPLSTFNTSIIFRIAALLLSKMHLNPSTVQMERKVIKGDTGAQGIAGRNGRDGVDGHNGKDGVTTTITQR